MQTSEALRARLVRVARALEVSAAAAADRLSATPLRDGPDEDVALLVKRSHEIAALCHELADRLSRP